MLRLFALLLACTSLVRAADPAAFAIPTFESLGLYYNRAVAKKTCDVKYRAAGTSEWRAGYPMVYDPREKQYRGSLVLLAADTEYEVRLDAGDSPVTFKARTRSEVFPIGKAA